MSYRDPEQALEEPCEDIIKGIDLLQERIRNRMDEQNEPWKLEHLVELETLAHETTALRRKLAILRRDNW